MSSAATNEHETGLEIAIVGMVGRFPGANSVEAFWRNLRDGVESISFFSDQELLSFGVDPAALNDPNYVKAGAVLEDVEQFDASFFGYSPREAEMLDPQQRLFLECAWEALERAGYDPEAYGGAIGVYAGVGLNTYWFNLFSNRAFRESVGDFQAAIGNDRDFLTTRVSYKLNLKGPSITVQTACSTSLVAVHQACQSLLSGGCDMALAGGVSVHVPQIAGYVYREGGITSPDGHCRAFDARSRGTIFGSGMGIVVLKRLVDALDDGDTIHAVVKGSAINNDGALKVGYTAPSVDGQAHVIRAAQLMAEVEAETIGYVETHGTGTPLGDPIEIAALTQAFRASTPATGFCAIGSVKTNVGHLDAASGVTGLIKAVLALKHRQIPPSLHFEQPNPQIDFANSPFYVNTTLSEWKSDGVPRRAGVSSFGIGGTNAHAILEEAPAVEAAGAARPWQLLPLSAKTSTALEAATANLADHLSRRPDLDLADVAYTLQVGRRAFEHRRMLVCRDRDDALAALETRDSRRVFTAFQEPQERPVVFLFPGQGAQYVDMARDLYESEPAFREVVDRCAEALTAHLGLDLRTVLYPQGSGIRDQGSGSGRSTEGAARPPTPDPRSLNLDETWLAQPALFTIEYALAQLWMSWGVRPQALIGHSIGEYVAACLAGVLSLEAALALVALRGHMIQAQPAGAMLSVPLPERDARALLGADLSLAAVNAPALCVVSGATDAIEALHDRLSAQGVDCRRLHTSHAFHSAMLDPIVEPFAEQVRHLELAPPTIPFVSNVTGTWITPQEATDPRYWARHLRQTVRFADGMAELLKEPGRLLLEVGPGQTLSTFARQHLGVASGRIALSSLRHPHDRQPDVAFLLKTLGQLWLAGVPVDWGGFNARQRRRRLPLPTYPFERQRYWIETQHQDFAADTRQPATRKRPDIADWFSIPAWRQSMPPVHARDGDAADRASGWLVFADTCELGARLVRRLEQMGRDVVTVTAGDRFACLGERAYAIDPRQRADYDALLDALRAQNRTPGAVVHLWSVTPDDRALSADESFEMAQERGFYSLVFLAHALGRSSEADPVEITVISNNMQDVSGEAALYPEKATLLGPCRVIPQEHPNIACRSVDIALPAPGTWRQERLVELLLAEMTVRPRDVTVAYRGNHRWTQTFEPVRLESIPAGRTALRDGGVYLITGGLEGVGLALAEHMARAARAKLILVERAAFPARETWDRWLAAHDDREAISRKIRNARALEQLGAETWVVSADTADQEAMNDVIARAAERWGDIHGVVHAEGASEGPRIRAAREIGDVEPDSQIRASARRLLALETALRDRTLDFCAIQSSLSSVLGGLGLVDYSAANLFMDAFVRAHNQTSRVPWISVNWDGWKTREEQAHATALGSMLGELGITPEEGVDAFQRIVSVAAVPQIVVSTGDLEARIGQWIEREPLTARGPIGRGDSNSFHPRPSLHSAYVAPENEIERKVADTWQLLLGIEQVGVHDNFFELGGHSLLATQLISRLSDAFQVELPVRSLFEAPTVADMASVIAQQLAEQVDSDMLAALAQLSGDEVRVMLMAEKQLIAEGDPK